jgi:hypothetical protein
MLSAHIEAIFPRTSHVCFICGAAVVESQAHDIDANRAAWAAWLAVAAVLGGRAAYKPGLGSLRNEISRALFAPVDKRSDAPFATTLLAAMGRVACGPSWTKRSLQSVDAVARRTAASLQDRLRGRCADAAERIRRPDGELCVCAEGGRWRRPARGAARRRAAGAAPSCRPAWARRCSATEARGRRQRASAFSARAPVQRQRPRTYKRWRWHQFPTWVHRRHVPHSRARETL